MTAVRALARFFRTPPLALRIALGFALAVEALGLGYGLVPIGPVVRDAITAGSARVVTGTLVFAASVSAIHLVLATIVTVAALIARRAPGLAAIVAVGPLALAWLG
nr:hypothetical protein [Candidatus Eremiobacteraeota bacterium]